MGNNRKIGISLLALLVVATSLSYSLLGSNRTHKGNQILLEFNKNLQNCNLPNSDNKIQPYNCYVGVLQKNKGKIPYQTLVRDIERNNPVGTLKGYCHNTVHDIGVLYYQEIDGNSKLSTLCGDALFHGVIQEAAKRGDYSKIKRLLESSCKDENGNYSDVCIHGIGHVLWESTQDLTQFMSKCIDSTKLTVPSYEFYILTCVDGFLMKGSKNTVLKPDVEFVAADTIDVTPTELKNMYEECLSYKGNLSLGCQGLLFRWYYPNYLKNAKTINFTEYNFMARHCLQITDRQAKDLCVRQTGIIAYDYMIYYNDYTYTPVSKFCNAAMLVGCLDAYFEKYIDFPATYIKTKSMDNFAIFSTKVCNSIKGSYDINKCLLIAKNRVKMAIK